jgi:arylsulfatase A-like enzyme
MNFQAVSTAQKLPTSGGLAGGYDPTGTVPGPVLSSALAFVDHEVGSMLTALQTSGELNDTVLILSAKHGQSPTDTAALTRIDDGAVTDALNAAWATTHPGTTLVAQSTDDDGMLLWLNDRSPAATAFARQFLAGYDGTGTGADGTAKATSYASTPKAYHAAGLSTIYAGAAAASFIGVPTSDARVPDLIGIAQHGTVFTGGTKKIAEHGGDDPQDRNVPLVVAAPQLTGRMIGSPVETTQIAPTILRILGLDPQALSAVRAEGTPVLPLG